MLQVVLIAVAALALADCAAAPIVPKVANVTGDDAPPTATATAGATAASAPEPAPPPPTATPTPAPTPTPESVPPNAERRASTTGERWSRVAASSMYRNGPPETLAGVAAGCTGSAMPGAMLHRHSSLREVLDFGLYYTDAVSRSAGRSGVESTTGWWAAWLALSGRGVCVASFRYVYEGETKVASFYLIPGEPAAALPANEAASTLATLADANHDRETRPGSDARPHLVAANLRTALREDGLVDAYVDPDDRSVIVLRTLNLCGDRAMLGAIMDTPNVVRELRESAVRRVECVDLRGDSAPVGMDVPAQRHGHRR